MTYHKPILQPLQMNVDVAACKPCPRGTIRVAGTRLCVPFAHKTYVQAGTGGQGVSVELGDTPTAPPLVDGVAVLS